jgi:hypothetical protein
VCHDDDPAIVARPLDYHDAKIADSQLLSSDSCPPIVDCVPGDVFQFAAKNPLGEATQATPAIAHGRMYFRTLRHVLAIGGVKAQ